MDAARLAKFYAAEHAGGVSRNDFSGAVAEDADVRLGGSDGN